MPFFAPAARIACTWALVAIPTIAPALSQGGAGADGVAADSPAPLPVYRLGEIEVSTEEIYPDDSKGNSLRRLINATHWTTKESVVRREIWRRPGESVTTEFAEELERNLRSMGLFAFVSVELVPSSDPNAAGDVRDLRVVTRDRLSISGGAGAAFVGDVASGSISLSDSNVLGTGDRLRFSFTENDFGESRGQVSYRDRYLFGTWTTATAQGGKSEEGNFFGLRFDRPFRYLEDKRSWDLTVGTSSFDRDYFFSNSTIAEVPVELAHLGASVRWREGTRMDYWSRGLSARYTDSDYGNARGPAAPGVRVPGDTETIFAGGTLSWANLSEFRKVTNLDTLRFVQDVRIGTTSYLEAGAVLRDEDRNGSAGADAFGAGSHVQPRISADLNHTVAIGDSRYLSADLNGFVRTYAGEAAGWRTDLNLRAFDLSWQPHTLALAVSYTEADEAQDLPVQLTLGERSGLRGYPNREFVGQRIVRINLEDRIDLDAHLASFDFGAVVFADTAWIGERGEALDGPYSSAGFGLRIGSTPLLGRGVIRLDLSFPFDDANGESFDPLLSFVLGQVFTL